MPQRYDTDSLFEMLNRQLSAHSDSPNPYGVLHPAFSGLGHRGSVDNGDLARTKSEDLDIVDDVPAPWTPYARVERSGISPGSFDVSHSVEPADVVPTATSVKSERQQPPSTSYFLSALVFHCVIRQLYIR